MKNTITVPDATNPQRSLTLTGVYNTITFTFTDSDNKSHTVRVTSAEELLKLANFIGLQADVQIVSTGTRSSHPAKMGVCIFDYQGNRIKELYDIKTLGLSEDYNDYSYQNLTDTFGYDQAIFALFTYDGSIGRESIIKTLQACVKLQRLLIITGNYFYAKPLTLENVAKEARLDFTTVSRCARDVRVYGPTKTFSLDNHESTLEKPSLFDEGVEREFKKSDDEKEDLVARLAVLQRIKDMIDHEDKRNPMGDEEICQALKELHFIIERRTVAKYRGELLGLPNSNQRRQNN